MEEMLVPILVIGGLVVLYIFTYMINKRTPIPEECLVEVDKTKCEACHSFACSYKN